MTRAQSSSGNALTLDMSLFPLHSKPRFKRGLALKKSLAGKLDDVNTLANIVRFWYQLRRNQWKRASELRKIQLKRLKAVVRHAYYNVPYYHRIFKSVRIKPEQIRNLEDLQRIPMTTKSDVQNNHSNFISRNVDLSQCKISFTSGSTGRPLKVISSPKARYYSLALLQYPFFESGLKLRDKLVEVKVHLKNPALRRPINIGFLGRMRIPSENTIEENIRILKKIRPDALYTYPSLLLLLASEIEKKNIAEINPRLVFSHGETLTPRGKQLVNSVLDTNVHNMYGSVEFNRLAFQCNKHSGLHMITDSAVIEIIKGDEPAGYDELGEIVVTGLYNYAMPFIRYKMGDVGATTDERCDCGRSWPLIKRIEGRSNDFSVLPNGRIVSPMNLIEVMEPKYVKGVMQYQIIQEKKSYFLVKVIVNKKFNSEQISIIQRRMRTACLGEDVDVDVQVVNELVKDKTGKFRVVISKVKASNLFG